MPSFCANCGTANEAGIKFCRECGTQVNNAPLVSPLTSSSKAAKAPPSGRGTEITRSTSLRHLLIWVAVSAVILIGAGGSFYTYRVHERTSDAAIVKNIIAAFFSDPDLHKCTIEVTAEKGVVTLTGLVNVDSDKITAAQISTQQGARRVIDHLVLAEPPSSSQVASASPDTVAVLPPARKPSTGVGQANIIQAVIQNGQSSLQLPPGRIYLYGMSTGGASPSTPFATGQFAQAVNAAGQLSAALAYSNTSQNSYNTQTGFHAIGGVSLAGSWDSFNTFYGSNQQRGASTASAEFMVSENSVVVVIAVGSSQQDIQLQGVPSLHTDAISRGGGTESMIIAHANLPPGTYAVSETTRADGGQDPAHMVDLIGVFVLGSKDGKLDSAISQTTPAQSQIASASLGTGLSPHGNGRPAVTSRQQCIASDDAKARNNTHGTIQIMSGTGTFAQIGGGNRVVKASKGMALNGTVTLRVLNNGPGFAVAPLIEALSWGNSRSSWVPIANLKPGDTSVTAQVSARAPLEAGTYHIVFAFQLEMNGGNVASGTSWAHGGDVWDDGNEIARFDSSQIEEAQRFGCTVDPWLTKEGFQLFYVPADSITIEVDSPPATQVHPSQVSVRSHGDNTQNIDIHQVDFRNFRYQSDCSKQMGDGSNPVIRLSNGEWQKGNADEGNMVTFSLAKMTYGKLNGNGENRLLF
jgi:hypothetical protein